MLVTMAYPKSASDGARYATTGRKSETAYNYIRNLAFSDIEIYDSLDPKKKP